MFGKTLSSCRLLLLAPAALLVASCSSDGGAVMAEGVVVDTLANGAVHVTTPAEGLWELTDAQPWRLVEDLRIGQVDGEGPEVFGSVRNVIPDSLGRIWVMDSQAHELRVFDPEGAFVQTVGGMGEGPGEFIGNSCAFPGPPGEIWVEDARRRWQRFDLEGDLIESHPVTNNLGCGNRQWTPDGRFLVVLTEGSMMDGTRQTFFLSNTFSEEGELVPGDTISPPELTFEHDILWTETDGIRRIGSSIPFAHRPRWVLGPSGDFFVADEPGAYKIRRQSLAGDTLLVMERSFVPVPVSEDERAEAIDAFVLEGFTAEPSFSEGDVPTVHPPFDRFFIDGDGTVWVNSQRENGETALDVFSADGHYLGSAQVPDDFDRMWIHHVKGDHMYGRATDDLDVSYAVRLFIERP
ncbi:MAG: 6-bladed beta-propeller [Gemmatimonadales bacterium]|nr:MAG: 6-bladed beta-propeller [Gemmatimonadales bacterium]